MIQESVSIGIEDENNCTTILPGMHRHLNQWRSRVVVENWPAIGSSMILPFHCSLLKTSKILALIGQEYYADMVMPNHFSAATRFNGASN